SLDLRRDLLSSLEPQQSQGAIGIPPPSRAENRRRQRALLENGLNALSVQEMKDICQWKTMLLGKRNVEAIVGRCCLELEVETPAKTLAERQTPGLVDTRAEGRMNHQLHPSALIKEALGNDGGLSGNLTENGSTFKDVLDCTHRGRFFKTTFLLQPGARFSDGR